MSISFTLKNRIAVNFVKYANTEILTSYKELQFYGSLVGMDKYTTLSEEDIKYGFFSADDTFESLLEDNLDFFIYEFVKAVHHNYVGSDIDGDSYDDCDLPF